MIHAYFHSFSRNESRYERAPPPPRFARGGSGGRGCGGPTTYVARRHLVVEGEEAGAGVRSLVLEGGRKPQLTKQNSSELVNEEW